MACKGKFDGSGVLVTGAGTGIGQGVATAFAEAGANVVFHYTHSGDGAKQSAEAARGLGVRAEAMQADFNDVQQVQQLAASAESFLGRIDVLVNNSGITMNRTFFETTPEQFDTLFHVNIRAMFFLTQAVARGMADRDQGAVINLTSVHAYAGFREHSVYASTKGAIVAFTRTLSLELAPRGIRMNAIAPGWILVENHYKAHDVDEEAAARNIPAGFIGRPHDVAELALYLASDDARYVVGQTIIIDGGQLAIMPCTGDFREPVDGQFGKGYVPGL